MSSFPWSRPWLWLPSELSHNLSPLVLPALSKVAPSFDPRWKSLDWQGLHFRNPMGIAGGVDKKGSSLKSWQALGAGFLEVGTVTPEAQGPNPGVIIRRDWPTRALWNKMGFPNPGIEPLVEQLKNFKSRKVPLFINIGKNRWTANEEAHLDYEKCIAGLHPFADAFVINLSSPNTKGLRELQEKSSLQNFLNYLFEKKQSLAKSTPFLLKLSPDMSRPSFTETIEVSAPFVDGWILTNTTQSREVGSPFPSEGGVSGKPLKSLSLQSLEWLSQSLGDQRKDKLVVSVGGVDSYSEIMHRLEMGADLVQFYAALVFQGPFLFKKVLKAALKGS